jgi:hypothetical protein
MSKNTFFTGQPIFSQLLNLIPKRIVQQVAAQHKADYYTKKFDTYSHLVTMLFVAYGGCTSLREVEMGMSVCHNKLGHLGLSYIPARSTLSEANIRRDSEVFASIHHKLYSYLRDFLPDSRTSKIDKKLYIMDSSTISLFQEIMTTVGRPPINGKRKGGYKVHTLIKADEDVPRFIKISSAAKHDSPFLKNIQLPKGSVLTFDMGYIDYKQYNRLTKEEIWFVTRLKSTMQWMPTNQKTLSENQIKKGVKSDTEVILGHAHSKKAIKVPARIVCYRDPKTGRDFEFLTNNTTLKPFTIAQIYQKRWQIEVLFKRIKQNYPLKYFLGDNENAIRIQTWCALIADLLLKVIKTGIKRKWSFSGIVSIVRQHLLEYINLTKYLEQPEVILRRYRQNSSMDPPNLFTSINSSRGLKIQF